MDELSLECQLARAQLKRYLGGEELPDDLMRGLDTHVKACPGCKQHLDSQRLKLANDLAGIKEPKQPPIWTQWLDKLKPKKDPHAVFASHQPTPAMRNAKTLGLSVALAAVLFAMSAIAKDPTGLMGPRAKASLPPAEAKAADEAKPKAETTEEEDKTKEPGHEDSAKPSEEEGHSDKAVHDPKPDAEAAKPDDKPHGESAKPAEAEHKDSAKPAEPARDEPKEAAPTRPKQENQNLLVAEEGQKPKIKPAPRQAAPKPAEPRKATRKPTPRPAPRVRRSAPRQTQPKPAGIRVYDESGKRIR